MSKDLPVYMSRAPTQLAGDPRDQQVGHMDLLPGDPHCQSPCGCYTTGSHQ